MACDCLSLLELAYVTSAFLDLLLVFGFEDYSIY